MSSKTLVLNGGDLTIQEISSFIDAPQRVVRIADAALSAVQKSRDFLSRELSKKIIYGVNTGFGPMASHIVGRDQLLALQKNLIRSHAVGIGEPIKSDYVLAAMIVRLNTLVRGFSGVSPELVEHLRTFINKRIIPVVPEHGAVGTSGDLVQLAHIALALIGEGEVVYHGKRHQTADVLKRLRVPPYELKAKEGLALINGTSVMAGIAALLCEEARHLLGIAVRNGALALELVHGFNDGISEKLHNLRPHPGQALIAKKLRSILSSSRLLRDRGTFQEMFEVTDDVHKIPAEVQEVYSLRCTPQVLGPVFEALMKTWGVVETEINSVTDNPIVDWKHRVILHGGNFHGDYIASAVDQLKIALVKLTMLSERRTNFFLHQAINKYFPPFMNLKKPGLTLGLQGLQFVATSTTAQSQSFAFPHHIHSIPTNGDNQDIVSMGTDAALIAANVIKNARVVLAIELIALAQGVDFLGEKDKLCVSSRELFDGLRGVFPKIVDDRVIVDQLPKVVDFLKKNCGLEFQNGKR